MTVEIVNKTNCDLDWAFFYNPDCSSNPAVNVPANQSLNLSITYPYLNQYGYTLDYSNSSYPTINIIDYTDGADNVYIEDSLAKSINLQAFGVFGTIDFSGSYFLESLTIPSFCTDLYAYHLPYLKEVYLYDGYSLYPNNEIDFNTCSLSQESVDRILKACVNGGYSSKTIYLNGGNNAIPSSEGFNDISTLVSRGWDVYYND